MINPDHNYDFSELGFLRHFALVRFLYKQIEEYKEDNAYLREKILILSEDAIRSRVLTEDIKEPNNVKVDNISSDDKSEDFYKRREGETVEEFLERIGTVSKPKNKLIRSANDLIEEAKQKHIKTFVDAEQEKEEAEPKRGDNAIADSAIQRIGNSIKER